MGLVFDEGQGLVVGTPRRPSFRKMLGCTLMVALILWVLFFGLYRTATAQEPTKPNTTWYIFADTTHIAPASALGPNVYLTWVFAKATPTSWPSSGILVAWDCQNRMVKRLAQVKYSMNADSSGVNGPIEVVDRPWQTVSDERLYTLVCTIGPTHADESVQPQITFPTDSIKPVKPKSPYSDA